ncbi:hypothetical protein [uncultured Dubosiella sp.]|uniref:hypothetical protein n=1 Tax=uncultured Dubosiella sp. TaxID=1937011 RepID=UPI0025F2CE98|nr:hypothetical protein [uncultured Dubosiella sp.]
MKKFELIFLTLFFMDIFLLPVHGAQEEGSLTIHLDDPGARPHFIFMTASPAR